MAHQVTQPGWVTIARLHPIAWWRQVTLACNVFWFEIADGGSVAPAECQVLKPERTVSEEDTDYSSEGKGSALHLALPQFALPLSHLSPEWGASGATATHCCITLSSNWCQSVLDSQTSPLLPISLLPIWACCLCLQHQLPVWRGTAGESRVARIYTCVWNAPNCASKCDISLDEWYNLKAKKERWSWPSQWSRKAFQVCWEPLLTRNSTEASILEILSLLYILSMQAIWKRKGCLRSEKSFSCSLCCSQHHTQLIPQYWADTVWKALQFNSILIPPLHRERQIPQVKGSVPKGCPNFVHQT